MSEAPAPEAPVQIQVDAQPGGEGAVEVRLGAPTPDQAGSIGAIGVAPSVEIPHEKPQPPKRGFLSKLMNRRTYGPIVTISSEDGSPPRRVR